MKNKLLGEYVVSTEEDEIRLRGIEPSDYPARYVGGDRDGSL
jgi:hypothetical protein